MLAPLARQRLWVLAGCALLVGLGGWLVIGYFRSQLVFFYSPTELAGLADTGRVIRIGGLVAEGTIVQDGALLSFVLTDGVAQAPVRYEGLPPAMFRDGQGVVAEGHWDGSLFSARQLLTKHDENYMPPEVARSLKEKGVWQGNMPRETPVLTPAPVVP